MLKVIKEFASVGVARVACAIGGLVFGLIVARLGGADILGVVTFSLTLTTLFGVLGRWGIDTCLMKHVAAENARQNRRDLRPTLSYALVLTGGLGLLMIGGILAITVFAPIFWAQHFQQSGLILFAALPLSLFAVIGGYAKGIGRTALSGSMDIGLLSLIATFFIIPYVAIIGSISMTTIALIVVAVIYVATVFAVLWAYYNANTSSDQPPAQLEKTKFLAGSGYFTINAVAILTIQAGAFALVGAFMSSTELGLARAAERLALLVSFPLTVVNLFVSPRIVHHTTVGERSAIRKLMLNACVVSGGLALPIAAFLFLAPRPSLAFFGEEFIQAELCLLIFAATQFVTAITNPMNMYMFLGGHERELTFISVSTLLLCLILYPMGGYLYGSVGFAVAYMVVNSMRAALLIWRGNAHLR